MQDNTKSRASQLVSRLGEFKEWVALAKAQTGKGLVTQLREIRALRRFGGQCGLSDYYWYKLYDDDYQQGRGARDFLGWRLQQKFSLALNPRYAALPAEDKLSFMSLAGSAGLPIAPVRACFHRAERLSDAMGIHLKTRAAAGAFLRDPAIYPLFGKPSFSQQGYGAAYLAGYDATTDSLRLLGGKTISADLFMDRLEQTIDPRYHKPECGYLFQEPFTLAPEIFAITQWPAICGVRIICLNGPHGVTPIRACWKIAVPPNQVDNLNYGRSGNLFADVNLANGEVSRVLSNFWPKTKVMSQHPVTGKSIEGFRLPGWDKILEACKLAGAVFPLLRVHHWDFALTDRGPLMLELNDLGGTEGVQVFGHGLLTQETREFLKRYGNSREQPWINAL
jgi:hypothetical protein